MSGSKISNWKARPRRLRRLRYGKFQISNLAASALLFCLTISAFAKDVPTITVSKGDRINVNLAGLTGSEGASATAIVQKDLTLSGQFNLGGADASYVVKGTTEGGGLQGQVVDHSGGTVLSKSYSGAASTNAHQFANDIIETLTGNKGLAGSKITFIATRSGKKEVYVADYDGSHVRQLTHDNTISVHPSLSPGAERIAYTGYQSGYADVYVIDLGSGARNRIVNFPGTNSGAAFSPDGGRIALTISKDGNPELYTVSAGGGGARRLTHSRAVESGPTWSPDGDEIIYSFDGAGGPQLYRVSASGGEGRQIATGYGYCTEPDWSPDGKKVAFNVRSGGEFQIVVLDLAGGGKRTVGTGEDPAWGPDSRHVIFTEGGTLYMVDTVSSQKTKVLGGLGKITEPSWSR